MFRTLVAVSLFLTAKGEDTTAKGLATIEGNDIAGARDVAIKNALRQAIGQVAGEWVESRFSSEQKEAQGQFSQKIEDSVRVDVQGFVEKYSIVNEGRTANGYEVTITARVNTKKLTSLMEGLASAIEKAGRKPRVVIAVRERDVTSNTKVSLAGGFVQGQLIDAGLELLEAGEAWTVDAAKKRGADVIVTVDAEYKDIGKIGPDAEFAALVGQTRSEVKLALTSQLVRTNKMLSAKPVIMTSIGTDYGRSLQRALQGQGNNAVKVACHDFFTQLKDALDAGAIGGSSDSGGGNSGGGNSGGGNSGGMTVTVRKVKSYKTQAKPLMALLQRMEGVASVEEAGFANRELSLKVTGSGWEKSFFDSCERLKWCKSLDKLGGDANSLLLSF